MKKIIIGSSGYIGSSLKNFFLKKNEPVITCGRSNCDIKLDLAENNFKELENEISKGDLIYFLAAQSSPDYCENYKSESERINVLNTSDIIKKILNKNCRVVFASTDAVFGDSRDKVYEDSIHMPVGNYGLQKSKVEKTFQRYDNFQIVRFSYVVGGDKFTRYLQDDNEQKKQIFDGFSRCAVSINDVVEGLYNLNDNQELKAINFCGPKLLSRMDIALMYKKNMFRDIILDKVDAPEIFWLSRARVINMNSNYFSILLKRSPSLIKGDLMQ